MREGVSAASPPAEDGVRVPMQDVSAFVRQLSHDLRNHLNAAELQSAFIAEVAQDGEMKGEVQRLRAMLGEMSASLQRVATALAPIRLTPMPYEAGSFMEDLRQRVNRDFPETGTEIEWSIDCGKALLEIDPQVLLPAFVELFANAFLHGREAGALQARAETEGAQFRFTLMEPKAAFAGSTEGWGERPFAKLKHGHYGLGLARVREVIRAHGGEIRAQYDANKSALITTITLPTGAVA